jgi:hypothetical protein
VKPIPSSPKWKSCVVCCVAGLCFFAASSYAIPPNEIYAMGREANEKGDYVGAVKYLYAYDQVAPPNLPNDFRQEVRAAIDYAEAQVRSAVGLQEELEKHGPVISVTVSSSGKADTATESEKTVPFEALKKDVEGSKPALPQSPPRAP